MSLLGTQVLSELLPRFQKFLLRLMRYSYTISHTPGESLLIADTLSQAPVTQCTSLSSSDRDLMEDISIYVDGVLENVPASSTYLAELRQRLKADGVCSEVMTLCQEV